MIALYQGISFASRIIRIRNWSEYSHASWMAPDFSLEIEAWEGSVKRQTVPFAAHTPGTRVDLFEYRTSAFNVPETLNSELRTLNSRMQEFLDKQVGKPYDWPGILGFVTKRPQGAHAQAKWFCSELVHAATVAARHPLLLRIPDWKVYPGMLAYSPLLRFVRSCIVPDYRGLKTSTDSKTPITIS